MGISAALIVVDPKVPVDKPLLGLPPVIRTIAALSRFKVSRILVQSANPSLVQKVIQDYGFSERVEFAVVSDFSKDPVLHLSSADSYHPNFIEWMIRRSVTEVDIARTQVPSEWVERLDGSKEAYRRAEKKLFEVIRQGTEGWVAPRINKPVSFALTRLLLKTPVTPNQITFFNLLLALTAFALLMALDYPTRVIGAVCMYFSSIIDGCDGEVARLKMASSRFGAWFDTVADDCSNNLFVLAIFLGLYRATAENIYLSGGFLTFCLSLGVSLVIYHQLATAPQSTANAKDFNPAWQQKGDKVTWFERLRPLLKRDFFIAVLFVGLVLDWRAFLCVLSFGSAAAAFGVYAVSFVLSLKKK